jgi:hypothetical protein
MINDQNAQVGWGFWLGWLFASTVSLAVAGGVLVGLYVTTEGSFVLPQVTLGASIGVAQWLVLRGRVTRAGWWVLASTIGFALGSVLSEAVIDAITWGILGVALGIAQWFVLRRWVSHAVWWVLASAVPLAMLGVFSFMASNVISAATDPGNFFFPMRAYYVPGLGTQSIETIALTLVCASLVALVGYGAITGVVLVRLLRLQIREEPGYSRAAG